MIIRYERFLPRSMALRISRQLDLAGMKISVSKFVGIMFISSAVIFAVIITAMLAIGYGLVGAVGGAGGVIILIVSVMAVVEYRIDDRKNKMEAILPDYFQIASANLRSGIALERALLLGARPEFGPFADDVKEMGRRVFSGEAFEDAMRGLANKYKSRQLAHSVRMMLEAIRYGGAMADLLEQIAKDLRSQQMVQKEVSGQLFMYSLFIVFAGLVAAPALFGLTTQMITFTDAVWKQILASNPGGLPSTGLSFLRPSPPKVTPGEYYEFAIACIIMIAGFGSVIVSAINTGSAVRGIRYTLIFIIVAVVIFVIVQAVVSNIFSSIAGIGVS